jgi:hypothetical protein
LPVALLDCRLDRGRQRSPTCGWVAAERHAQHGQSSRGERLEVAKGLRLLEDREAERLPRNGDIASVILYDL